METCYKAFRREIIQGIDIEENSFGFEPEVTAKVARIGCRIDEVSVSYSGRSYAEGKKIGWIGRSACDVLHRQIQSVDSRTVAWTDAAEWPAASAVARGSLRARRSRRIGRKEAAGTI